MTRVIVYTDRYLHPDRQSPWRSATACVIALSVVGMLVGSLITFAPLA